MDKSMALTEEVVARIWGRGLAGGQLQTTGGQPLHVIHPGRANSDRGPDFKDAVLAMEGRRLAGDVEVHSRSSQWRGHGHHRDPAYNGVILQVVWQDDAPQPTQLQSGRLAPVLALGAHLSGSAEEVRSLASAPAPAPCSGVWEGEGLAAVLEGLGRERLRDRADRFELGLETKGPDQVLYEGMMRALGYSKNREPLLELARRMSLARLTSATAGLAGEEALPLLEALLLGGAGLLPSQRRLPRDGDHPYVAPLEGLWRGWGGEAVLHEADWCFFRVRPENLPARRLAAAARLLARHGVGGLWAGMAWWLGRALCEHDPRRLEAALMVTDDGYWAEHYDFGLRVRMKTPGLVGRGRAAEVAVNVLLPFSWAFSSRASSGDGVPLLSGVSRPDIVSLYNNYPKLGDNHIIRYMVAVLWGGRGSPLVNSACRQQGLIHLYRGFCAQHRCLFCPLFRPGC